jgi:molybdopterin-biosynthesis enzyme MoeA-like protein
MQTTIKNIVDQFFKETKLNKVQEVEKKLINQFGESFIEKNINQISLKNNKVIIKTKTIEAKTEINLFKKKITTPKIKVLIV